MLLVMLVTKQLLNIKPLQTDQRAPHTAGTGAAPITTTGTIRHLTSQMRLRLGELQRAAAAAAAAAAVVADAAGAGAAARLLRRGEQVGGGGGGRVGGGWLGVAALGVLARLLGGGAWPLGVVFAQVGQLF